MRKSLQDFQSMHPSLSEDYHHPDASPGWNSDSSLCQSCLWRNTFHQTIIEWCDYITFAGHMRGCSWRDCDKYERQKKGQKRVRVTASVAGNKTVSEV